MKRLSVSQVRAILVGAAVALSPISAQASVTRTPVGSPITETAVEKRLVPIESIEVRGEKTLLTRQPFVEEALLGATSKLITEKEHRTYQIPFMRYAQSREEAREITTSTQRYRVTTSNKVVDQTRTVWMVGGKMSGVNSFTSDLAICWIAPDGDYRNAARLGLRSGRFERDQDRYNRANALAVTIDPYKDGNLISHLYFNKKTLTFMGGAIFCHGNYAKIPWAKIKRYSNYDSIQYQLDCPINNDWWPFDHCATGDHVWELRLDGRILEQKTITTYKTVTTTTHEDKQTTSHGPWTETGTIEQEEKPLSTRYETETETVTLARYTVPNGKHTQKALAPGSADQRRIFSADSSSAQQRASLSGTKVRQKLGANQATPSRAKTPHYSGGVPGSKKPELPGAAAAGGQHAGAGGGSGNGASGNADSWRFPMNPMQSPLRDRFEEYRTNR